MTGLVLLKRKLIAEMEYRQASPSMRLLNEIMSLMAPTADADEAEQDMVTLLSILHLRSTNTTFSQDAVLKQGLTCKDLSSLQAQFVSSTLLRR